MTTNTHQPATDSYTAMMIPVATEMITSIYYSGLLQYHPATVLGITLVMSMHSTFNTLTVSNSWVTRSVNLYDSDSAAATEHAITDLVSSLC